MTGRLNFLRASRFRLLSAISSSTLSVQRFSSWSRYFSRPRDIFPLPLCDGTAHLQAVHSVRHPEFAVAHPLGSLDHPEVQQRVRELLDVDGALRLPARLRDDPLAVHHRDVITDAHRLRLRAARLRREVRVVRRTHRHLVAKDVRADLIQLQTAGATDVLIAERGTGGL